MESLCRAFNNISSKVGVLHPDVEWSKTGKLIWDYLRFITEYPLHLPTFYFGVPGWVRWTCRTKVVSQCDTEHELSEVESIQFPKPATLRTGSMTSFLDPLPNWEVYPPNNHKSLNISMSLRPIQTNEAPKESTQCALRDRIDMTLWHLKPLHHHCNMDPKISTCPVERHRPFNISAGNGPIGTNEMPKESLEWFLRGCAIQTCESPLPYQPPKFHLASGKIHKCFNISAENCPMGTNNTTKESSRWALCPRISTTVYHFKPINLQCRLQYRSKQVT